MKTKRYASALLIGISLTVAVSLAPAATLWADSATSSAAPSPSMANVHSAYGKLPLSFEANHGQMDSQVQFLSRGRGHTLFLTPSDAVLALRTGETNGEGRAHLDKPYSSPPPPSQSMVRMTFKGANSQAEMVGLDPLPGIVNYFIGSDPSNWRTNDLAPLNRSTLYVRVEPKGGLPATSASVL